MITETIREVILTGVILINPGESYWVESIYDAPGYYNMTLCQYKKHEIQKAWCDHPTALVCLYTRYPNITGVSPAMNYPCNVD